MSKTLGFAVPLTVSGIRVAEVEGSVELLFPSKGRLWEIWIIRLDGRDAEGNETQRTLERDHPLYDAVKQSLELNYDIWFNEAAWEHNRKRAS